MSYINNDKPAPSTDVRCCTPNAPISSNIPKARHTKREFVEKLVDASALVIESLWPNPNTPNSQTQILGLKSFIRETLKRSKTTFCTLLTALIYILRIKEHIPKADAFFRVNHLSEPGPKSSLEDISVESPLLTDMDTLSFTLVKCGRRMFLAALILASKFLADRSCSNRAWAKITGLNVAEISACELTLLRLLDYRLFITATVFSRWSTLLFEEGHVAPNLTHLTSYQHRRPGSEALNQKPLIGAEPTILYNSHDHPIL